MDVSGIDIQMGILKDSLWEGLSFMQLQGSLTFCRSFNSAITASLIDSEKQQLPDSESFKDSISYLWRSFVALEQRSVVWCQQSLQTPGGWGVRGSVSACPTRCGTTSGGHDTARSHSPTNANAEKEKEIGRWNGDGVKRKRERSSWGAENLCKHFCEMSQGRSKVTECRGRHQRKWQQLTLLTLPAGRMWCAGIILHKSSQNIDITASFPGMESPPPVCCEQQWLHPEMSWEWPRGRSMLQWCLKTNTFTCCKNSQILLTFLAIFKNLSYKIETDKILNSRCSSDSLTWLPHRIWAGTTFSKTDKIEVVNLSFSSYGSKVS